MNKRDPREDCLLSRDNKSIANYRELVVYLEVGATQPSSNYWKINILLNGQSAINQPTSAHGGMSKPVVHCSRIYLYSPQGHLFPG